MGRGVRIIVIALLVASLPVTASAKWSRLRTEHFVFIGDASDGTIRRVAQKLDQFRDVLTRALPGSGTTSPVPTLVIVFRSDSSFTPYKPLFQGRPVAVAGYFQPAEDINYIAVNGEADETAFHTIFHEYTHFLVGNTAGDVPPWVGEGLAELYATFQERNGGTSAVIGAPDVDHVALLRASALMPLRELMVVDHSSPVYNEGHRRSLFYAESWALMHYLMLGNKARTPQIGIYLEKLRNGAAPERAFGDAFGDLDALERELNGYVRRYQFVAARFDFGESVTGGKGERSVAIDDAEASAYLGDLLARTHRTDDARAHFRKLIEAAPQSARAAYGLGRLEMESGHLDEALPLLERAVALDGNEAAYQTALGRALLSRWDDDKTGAAGAGALRRAREVLARSAELDPHAVITLVALGRADLAANADLPRAKSLFEQAARMAPSREYYRLLLAASLAAQNDFGHARAVLGPLLARGRDQRVRDAARDLLGRMSRSAADAGREVGSVETPSSVLSEPPAPPRREEVTAPTFRPVLRTLGQGEMRVLGRFTAVDCRRDAIVFTLAIDGGLRRFAAEKFADVEFISYRSEPPGRIECGPVQPPPRVLATYRASDTANGVDARLVAIELLPDGYTPN